MKNAIVFQLAKSWRNRYIWTDLPTELDIEYVQRMADFEGRIKLDLKQNQAKWLRKIEELRQYRESTLLRAEIEGSRVSI